MLKSVLEDNTETKVIIFRGELVLLKVISPRAFRIIDKLNPYIETFEMGKSNDFWSKGMKIVDVKGQFLTLYEEEWKVLGSMDGVVEYFSYESLLELRS